VTFSNILILKAKTYDPHAEPSLSAACKNAYLNYTYSKASCISGNRFLNCQFQDAPYRGENGLN
jgi:hypothetical protein